MEIQPFTKEAIVRIFNPNNGEEYQDVEINVPRPNFEEDTTERSQNFGEEEIVTFDNDGDAIDIEVSAYNTITGGGIIATCNDKEVDYEIINTVEEGE